MKKAYSILLLCTILFLLVSCGRQVADFQDPASQEPVSGENEKEAQLTDTATKNSEGEASPSPSTTFVPAPEDDNPYAMNTEHMDFWNNFINEAGRLRFQ